MFKLGMYSFYSQVLELTKSLSGNMTSQYHRDGAFCPAKLTKSVFAILAEENCDIKTTSSNVLMHFHGTSTTNIHYPTKDN